VRKVMVVAHEHGLMGRVELVPPTVSPVQANESLAADNPLTNATDPNPRDMPGDDENGAA